MKRNEKNSEISIKTSTKVYNYTNLSRKKIKKSQGVDHGGAQMGKYHQKIKFRPP